MSANWKIVDTVSGRVSGKECVFGIFKDASKKKGSRRYGIAYLSKGWELPSRASRVTVEEAKQYVKRLISALDNWARQSALDIRRN